MINAFVLINCEPRKIKQIAEELVDIEGVYAVFSVTGPYDIVASVRVAEMEELSDTVTAKMVQIEGIRSTETMIAFRVTSRYDLERMFAVGLEDA